MILTIDPTIMINLYYLTRTANISFANIRALYPYMYIINVVRVKILFRIYLQTIQYFMLNN